MKTRIVQIIISGLLGTLAMTMVMLIAPFMGMPKMNPAAMLSMMLGLPLMIGWIMHFMIGIIFTLMYAFLLYPALTKIKGKLVKGLIFGFAAFIFAQIAMMILGAVFESIPEPEGSMGLILMGSIIGHVVFGVVAVMSLKFE